MKEEAVASKDGDESNSLYRWRRKQWTLKMVEEADVSKDGEGISGLLDWRMNQ